MKAFMATAETKDQHDSRREWNQRKVSAAAPRTRESTREHIARHQHEPKVKSEAVNGKMETDGTPGQTQN
jgi:hypothetical protein